MATGVWAVALGLMMATGNAVEIKQKSRLLEVDHGFDAAARRHEGLEDGNRAQHWIAGTTQSPPSHSTVTAQS